MGKKIDASVTLLQRAKEISVARSKVGDEITYEVFELYMACIAGEISPKQVNGALGKPGRASVQGMGTPVLRAALRNGWLKRVK